MDKVYFLVNFQSFHTRVVYWGNTGKYTSSIDPVANSGMTALKICLRVSWGCPPPPTFSKYKILLNMTKNFSKVHGLYRDYILKTFRDKFGNSPSKKNTSLSA